MEREATLAGLQPSRETLATILDLNSRSWALAQSDPRGALRLAGRALKLATAAGLPREEAQAGLNMGWARVYLGHYDRAVGDLSRARQAFALHSEPEGVMKATNALGVLSFRIGETGQALVHFQKAFDLALLGGDEGVQAVIQANLGRIHLEDGDCSVAMRELQSALEHSRAVGDRITEAEALTQIGRAITIEQGIEDPDLVAEELHTQSIELCEEVGHPAGVVTALEHLGDLLTGQGRLEEAEEHLRRAVAVSREMNVRVTSIDCLVRLADAYEAKGETQPALDLTKWILAVQREHAGADTASRIRAVRAGHEVEQARMEAELVRVRNVELREKTAELELSSQKLHLMYRIGSELTSTLDPDEIARRLHDRVNELMSADVFGVAFYDEGERVLDFAVVIEDNQRVAPFTIPVETTESFSSWVVRNQKEICLNDADKEYKQYLSRRSSITSAHCRSLVFLPLVLEGRVIGVLTVQSHRKRKYGPEEMGMLYLLAPYIAVAMDNSRKLQTIRELNQALEQEKHELESAYGRIAHMANHDMLTGLPNRRLLAELVSEYIPLARRHERIFGLLYIDLDDFKPVNDTFGHDAGDQVLVRIAERLNRTVRESDTVARIGGDEFVLIVREVARTEDVFLIASKILEIIREPVAVKEHEFLLAASIGVSLFPNDGATYDELLTAADRAMYAAKESGKSGISSASDLVHTSRNSSSEEIIASPSKRNRPST